MVDIVRAEAASKEGIRIIGTRRLKAGVALS